MMQTHIPARPLLVALITLVLLGGVLGGCVEDFDPYWRVSKFRLLAIKSDPISLSQGEAARLTALVHDPDGDDISYQWEWCPVQTRADDRYACPITAEDLQEILGDQQGGFEVPDDVFDLGARPVARLPYPGTRQQVLSFCRALLDRIASLPDDSPIAGQLPTFDCEAGIDIAVRLTVSTPDDEIIARKLVTLDTGGPDENHNPDVRGLSIRVQKLADISRLADTLDWVAETQVLDNDDWYGTRRTTPIVAGVPFEIQTVVSPDSIEMWRPPAPEGSDQEYLPPEEEALEFRWFISHGDLNQDEQLFAPEINTLAKASTTSFVVNYDASKTDYDDDGVANSADNCPPLANPDQLDSDEDGLGDACLVRIWSVVRDARLGVDWIERRFRIVGWQ